VFRPVLRRRRRRRHQQATQLAAEAHGVGSDGRAGRVAPAESADRRRAGKLRRGSLPVAFELVSTSPPSTLPPAGSQRATTTTALRIGDVGAQSGHVWSTRTATATSWVSSVGFRRPRLTRIDFGAPRRPKGDFVPLNRGGGGCLLPEPNETAPWLSHTSFCVTATLVGFYSVALDSVSVAAQPRTASAPTTIAISTANLGLATRAEMPPRRRSAHSDFARPAG
jgi:hypothetical protein